MELPAEILESTSQIKAIPEFKLIEPRQRRFIIAYSKTFNIQLAANVSRIPWVNHYAWLKRSPDYRKAFEFAREIAGDFAEGDIYQRAFVGEPRKVTKVKGNEVITEEYKDKSDILSMFLLKGLKPQYRDSFNPAGAAAPITLSIISPIQQPAEIDVTNQGNSSDLPKKINPPD